ncbi:GNAT family N-acetyltransferase [Promethearchaeum syntrophicum]|uniref:GNAT family N-acetyltransferase n=1 Tax=Promethearchaeum syntrophicum TaxID=2594042 RepID=A0A5B9D9B4_9ARCH|nr:GNAT family protein [Candidatus Prometheoarchaeum syntrophicum]QEE15759.1 hypothetical protein DSAG12_01586 [Candidatus Prometheoarchaeum syntrophicum]
MSDIQPPQAFLQGNDIDLKPMTKEIFKKLHPWMNDHRSRRLARHVLPVLEETTASWIQEGKLTPSGVVMGIWTKSQHDSASKNIGFVSIFNIDWINRHGELGINIPNPLYWGQGYGQEAVKLMCQFSFTELNLEKVTAYTLEINIGSQKCMERNKFQKDGTLRNHQFVDGKYENMTVFSILRDQYTA